MNSIRTSLAIKNSGLGEMGDARKENFKISNGKVGLMMHHWKHLFNTINLIHIVLSCDDYCRRYRFQQNSNSITIIPEIRQNF